MLTLGSLFDGIGGFPLAAVRSGVTPLWASEIEAFPIEVTKTRFPDMVHVGDITRLDGAKLPPVDVLCGGSPCQDLSVAGARRGLAGERSGLFMEQVRIAKEMRKADEQRNVPAHLVRPRYLVWENVPGAFSSAGGEDFRAVIEEIVRVKDGSCHVPRPESGRWESAGAVFLGTEFSLAWRVLDAQYWGVAQRRRRIFLVADFGGRTAPEILFKQDGLFGDTAAGRGAGQGAAAPAEGGPPDPGGACLTPWDVQSRRVFEETGVWPALYGGEGGGHGYIRTEEKRTVAFAANQRDEVRDLHDIAGALGAQPGMKQQTFVATPQQIQAFHVNQRDEIIDLHGISGALLATRNMQMQTFVAQDPKLCINDQGGERMDITEEVTCTLRAGMGSHPPLVSQPNCLNGWDTQQSRVFTPEGTAPTLAGADGGGGRNPAGLVFAAGFCAGAAPTAGGIGYQEEVSPTLKAAESGTNQVPSVLCLNDQGGRRMDLCHDVSGTLRARMDGHPPLVLATQQGGAEIGEGVCPTITASAGMSGNNQPVLFENYGIDSRYTGPHSVSPTLSARNGTGGNNLPMILEPEEAICIAGNAIDRQPQNGGNGLGCQEEVAYTLTATDHHAVYSRQRVDVFKDDEIASTQSARQHKDATDLVCQPYQQTVGTIGYSDHKGVNNQFVSEDKCIVEPRNLIRRLTPLECERLQGFPDGWTDIPGASDSARYKALGNSVAIPCVEFLLRGIAFFLRKIHEEQEDETPCTSTPTT